MFASAAEYVNQRHVATVQKVGRVGYRSAVLHAPDVGALANDTPATARIIAPARPVVQSRGRDKSPFEKRGAEQKWNSGQQADNA